MTRPQPKVHLQRALTFRRKMCRRLAVASLLALFARHLSWASGSETNCNVGTAEEDCFAANDNEFFFCTDRYSWEWSRDAQQLPKQASDSSCITMDSNVIPDLVQTEILVLGGCDGEVQDFDGGCPSLSRSTRVYDPHLDVFDTQIEDMPTQRFRSAAVNVSQYVYLFGGRAPNGSLVCHVDRYDALERTWVTLNTSQDANCYSDHSGVASDDGTIFLFGGYNEDYESHDTVVKVEVSGEEITFSTSTPMGQHRGDHVCTKIPGSSEVYCMGGFTFNGTVYNILRSVERFDMDTETWEFRSQMVLPRADFALGHLNGRITVVGGEDNDGPMDDVEWYDPEEDCWTDSGDLFDLPYKRLRYCGATHESDQRIYIFGGQSLPGPNATYYLVNDTVNWYQEVLADKLTASSAGDALMKGSHAALVMVTAFVTAMTLMTGLV